MKKFWKNVFQALVILGALPMLMFVYAIFLKIQSEDGVDYPNRETENYFHNVIVKKFIIVYYVLIAICLIWKSL